MPVIRLDKLLADMGHGSRKEVKEMINAGKVLVDGSVVKSSGHKIDTGVNHVSAGGRCVEYKKYIYLMLNKPSGVISSTENSNRGETTVIDILCGKYKHYDLFPVGRLDKDTTGLLLLTNDGHFAHNTLSPKKHVQKLYSAIIDRDVTEADIAAFATGIELDDGYRCKSAELVILKDNEVTVEISEGKYHQIKRMFQAVGKTVVSLRRIRFGDIVLDETLKEGETRELSPSEMELIQGKRNYLSC